MNNPFNEPTPEMCGQYIIEVWDGFEWQTYLPKDGWVNARVNYHLLSRQVKLNEVKYKAVRLIHVVNLDIRGVNT